MILRLSYFFIIFQLETQLYGFLNPKISIRIGLWTIIGTVCNTFKTTQLQHLSQTEFISPL